MWIFLDLKTCGICFVGFKQISKYLDFVLLDLKKKCERSKNDEVDMGQKVLKGIFDK